MFPTWCQLGVSLGSILFITVDGLFFLLLKMHILVINVLMDCCLTCSLLMVEPWFPQQFMHAVVCLISWVKCLRKHSMMQCKLKLFPLCGTLLLISSLLPYLHLRWRMKHRQLLRRVQFLKPREMLLLDRSEIWSGDCHSHSPHCGSSQMKNDYHCCWLHGFHFRTRQSFHRAVMF